jgi:hypothetical protein
VPRKYHRPPDTTTKRRKPRKAPIPYEFAGPSESAVDVDEAVLEDGIEQPPALATSVPQEALRSGISGKAERHVNVDYSYVRGEVVRIVSIIGFLVIALIITSIFR